MAEHSKDYHNYVFRDGRLVGDFEAMYRYSETVPWHQDRQEDWIDIRLTVEMLRDFGRFSEIHDLGCGLGYYLAMMRGHLGSTDCRAYGYDISETACAKALTLFPDCRFNTLDLTAEPGGARMPVESSSAASRLFIIRGTLWYVFPKLATVVATIRSLMSGNDRLLVVQNFPPLDRPFVGKDAIPDHRALLRHFSASFQPVRHIWYEDTLKSMNDNWFIGLFFLGNDK